MKHVEEPGFTCAHCVAKGRQESPLERVIARHPILQGVDVSVPSGWVRLLDSLASELEAMKAPPLAQIKSKFGGLRVYFDGGLYAASDIVVRYENLAAVTCEKCGSQGAFRHVRNGWVSTLCMGCGQ